MIYPSPSAKRSASRDISWQSGMYQDVDIRWASARAMPCAPVSPACATRRN